MPYSSSIFTCKVQKDIKEKKSLIKFVAMTMIIICTKGQIS